MTEGSYDETYEESVAEEHVIAQFRQTFGEDAIPLKAVQIARVAISSYRNALHAAGLCVEQGWQPIETAPKDTDILGFWQYVYPGDEARTCGMVVISWDEETQSWTDGEEYVRAESNLYTHWRPLPAPPATESDT